MNNPLVPRPQPPLAQTISQGMFSTPYAPMYQPQPVDGISSAVSQVSGGMDDAYTNRLLGALGLGDVSQYQVQQPMYQPMPFYGSSYGMSNPFLTGMFSPYMQQTTFDTTARDGDNPSVTKPTVGQVQQFAQQPFGLMSLLPFYGLAQLANRAYVNQQAKDPTSDFWSTSAGFSDDGGTYTTSTGREVSTAGMKDYTRDGLEATTAESSYGFGD